METSNSVSLQFLGAAGTVTGSKYLLKTPSLNLMIDCGLFQGLKALRLKNWETLGIDVSKIDAVLLTHAHLDHCGYLPLLGKQGFKGKIYCTAPTRDLTEVILRDSAKIQEEDAGNANRFGYTKHEPAVPLYTEKDVEVILPLLTITDPDQNVQLNSNISFRFRPNGHILGSAFIEIFCYGKKILFSGDLGRPVSTLLNEPVKPSPADFVIMESTYGDRLHPEVNIDDQLSDVIIDTAHQKGNLLIPSFAVGRAQELMHLINQLKKNNRIPNLPVYMDSPMGAEATSIFRRYPLWHKLSKDECGAFVNDVTIIRKFEDTINVADQPGPKIVIAASGMLTGGRVLYYLEKYLQSKKNTILFTGYQSEGTRGRAILNGAHEVKIHGTYVPIRMKISSLSAMSGHADQKEMIAWLSNITPAPQKIFLVHGENGAREALRVKIESSLSWSVVLPTQSEEYALFPLTES
jgi:metallo-beta-lactamase family protein